MLPFGLNSIAGTAAGALGVRLDPYLAHNFLVEIDGILSGGFSTVSGLEATIDVEDRPEGGVNSYTRKVLRGATHPNLVLAHGLSELDTLWTWFDLTRQGVIQRKNMTVMLLDTQRLPVMWWDVKNALPIAWRGPAFDASQTTLAVETIELVHFGITKPAASSATAAARLVTP